MALAFIDRINQIGEYVLGSIQRVTQSQPADATAITGLTASMLGLAVAFTPRRSGQIQIQIDGNITCDTTAKTTTAKLMYGTGTAPANAAAETGTQAGITHTFKALTGMLTVPCALNAFINVPANVNTAMWFDFSVATDDAAAAGNMTGLNFVIREVS